MNFEKNKEKWKPIPGYEGIYEASTLGKIKSLKPGVFYGRIMKQSVNKRNGYCYVCLSKNGKAKNVRVHKYIALTFLENNDSSKTQINHLDGDKTNNKIENLEYCTGKENMHHAYKTGLEKRAGIKTICLDNMKVYESLTDAAKDVSGNRAQGEMVARVCRGERSHYRGFF